MGNEVRILHISDVHCNRNMLKRVLHVERFDLVLLSGDLQCYDLLEELEPFKENLLAVTGNMDDLSIARALKDLGVLIDGKVARRLNLVIGGIGGLDPITSLEELKSKVSLEGVDLDILMSHHPPKGVVDRTFIGLRAGLSEIRELIEEIKPKVHLCGHIHEARGIGNIGETIIVNPGPLKRGYYAIVYMGERVRAELKRLH